MTLNLTQLKYFCQLYDSRNYSKAADQLFLTRQALRKSISTLEEEVGGELFSGKTGMLSPTPLADFLYPDAIKLLQEEEKLSNNIQEFIRSNSHTLHVGVTFSVLETFAPSLPIDFMQAHPNINLDIQTIPDSSLESMVELGKLDCAFVIGPPVDIRQMYSLCLSHQPLYLVMRPELTALRGEITIPEMAELPLLVVDERFS